MPHIPQRRARALCPEREGQVKVAQPCSVADWQPVAGLSHRCCAARPSVLSTTQDHLDVTERNVIHYMARTGIYIVVGSQVWPYMVKKVKIFNNKKFSLNHKSALTFLLFNIFCWNFNWSQISFWNARFRGVFMIGWLLVPPLGSLLKFSEMEIYKSWPNSRFHTWRVQKCVQMVQNSPEMNRSRWVDVSTYLVFLLTPIICGDMAIFDSQNIDLELMH